MNDSARTYLAGAIGAVSSRIVSMAAGVLSLWFLTRILGTEAFAGYSVAMSVVVLLGYSVGLGVERSMLVRIGELETDGRTLAGRRLMQSNLVLAAILAAGAAIGTVGALAGTESAQGRFTLALVPVIPATAVSLVFIVWFQANHRSGISQAMFGLTDGIRSLFFAGCFVLGAGPPGVVAGAIAGALAPSLLLAWRSRGRTRADPAGLGLSDLTGGLQFVLTRLSGMGLQHIDIIALGLVGSVTGTAQYVVAKRFAVLIQTGQAAFAPAFLPRVRRHLATGQPDVAEREYRTARVLGFSASLLLATAFVFVGRPLLETFGEFGFRFDAFMLLVAAHLFSVGVGFHGTFLSMTDDIRWSTANRVIGLVVFAVCLAVFVPRFDAVGASLSFLISTVLHDVVGVALLHRRAGLVALDTLDGATVALSTATLCAVGFGAISAPVGGALLLALFATVAARYRTLMVQVFRSLTTILSRTR